MQIESEVRLVLNLSLWISPRFSLFSFRTIVEKCSGFEGNSLNGERKAGSGVGYTQKALIFSVVVLNVISKATLFPT